MNGPVTPLTPEQQKQAEANVTKEGYVRRLPVAADIFIDEIAGGPMNETISTRWGRWAAGKTGVRGFVGRMGCRFLNLFQKNHDALAGAGDVERSKEEIARVEASGLFKK